VKTLSQKTTKKRYEKGLAAPGLFCGIFISNKHLLNQTDLKVLEVALVRPK
jgi:hypothetical protein